MATTYVFERRPPISRTTPDGNEYIREFSIQAPSYTDALARLDIEREIREGVIYQDASGFTDATAIALGLGGVPTTPLPSGSEGEWIVTVQYGPASSGIRRFLPLTINGPARKWIESSEVSELADTYENGNAIVNGAGEPVEPPLLIRRKQKSLFVEFQRTFSNELAASQWADQWVGYTNSQVYFGAAIRCLYCAEMSHSPTTLRAPDNMPVFVIRGRFDFRPPRTVTNNGVPLTVAGWDLLRLNTGRRMRWIVGGIERCLIEIRAQLPPRTVGDPPVANINPYSDTLTVQEKTWRNSELMRAPVMLRPDGTYGGVLQDATFGHVPIPTNYITGQLYPMTDFSGIGI